MKQYKDRFSTILYSTLFRQNKNRPLLICRPGSACTLLCSIQNPKFEIQNPKTEIRNHKSKIQIKSEIQNPKSAQKELLHNLHNASKSKIRNPKYKTRNPKSRPKFQNLNIKKCYITIQNPKIENPQNPAEKVWILDSIFGFWIPDFGFCPGHVPLGNNSGDGASRSEARI